MNLLYRQWVPTDPATSDRAAGTLADVRPITPPTRDGRAITGLCVPIGQAHQITEAGRTILETFAPGAFRTATARPGATVLRLSHSPDTVVRLGIGAEFTETPDGLRAVFRINRGTLGDWLLSEVDNGVHLGLSIGAVVLASAPMSWRDNLMHYTRAAVHLDHVAVTLSPAYKMAQVTGRARDANHERFRQMLAARGMAVA